MIARWIVALATAAALLVVACGGDNVDRTKAHLRLVNASTGYPQLEMRVDGDLRQGDVAYGAAANYVDVSPSDAETSIARAGGATSLLTFTPAVERRKYYTVLAWGAAGALKQAVLDDNVGEPATNRALLRVFNAAGDAGALDIYLTGADESLAESVPVQSAAAAGAIGSWITLTSGTWRLRVTAANSKTDVRLDVSGLQFGSRRIATLVLSAPGGVLLRGLLLDQQGGITQLAATQSRVRVVAGVPGAAVTISSSAMPEPLVAGVAAPAVTRYMLLPSGAQTLTVAVDGTALAVPSFAPDGGGDYTLLVHGPVATARVALLKDDNGAAIDTTQARVRLVNGMADVSAPLTLTVDFVPLAANVAAGTASGYGTLTATTVARVNVTAAGAGAALYSAADQVFAAGGVYSVFMLGTQAAPQGVVSKDR